MSELAGSAGPYLLADSYACFKVRLSVVVSRNIEGSEVVLVAHSMGCRVALHALLAESDGAPPLCSRASVLRHKAGQIGIE